MRNRSHIFSAQTSIWICLLLGTSLASKSLAEPNPVAPEKAEAQESPGDNPQHEELQDWLDAYEEGEVALPKKSPKSEAQPPPPIEELDQALQPVVLTLLHRKDEVPTTYAASGCGPKNERIDLLDNGIAPDTKEGDFEYTSILPVCPLGATTVQIYENGDLAWSKDFDLKSIGKDPAIRIERTASGFAVDTSSPDDFHQAANHTQNHGPGLPEQEMAVPPQTEIQNSKDAAQDLVYWVVFVGCFLLAIGAGFILARNRNNPDHLRAKAPPIPNKDRLPAALLETPARIQKVSVCDLQSVPAMTQALAKNHAHKGQILLLSAPENQTIHGTALSQLPGLLQFKGEPPHLSEMIETVNSLRRELTVVLLEKPGGLHRPSNADEQNDLEILSTQCRVPVFVIESQDQTPEQDDSTIYVPSDDGWSLQKGA